MTINPSYQPYYQTAHDLQYKIHDMTANSEHPSAIVLRQEVHQLVNDLELNKNPRDVENRIKIIQRQIQEAQTSGASPMSYEHTDYVKSTMEDMRRDIRGLSNY